jgi:hypothetical protein
VNRKLRRFNPMSLIAIYLVSSNEMGGTFPDHFTNVKNLSCRQPSTLQMETNQLSPVASELPHGACTTKSANTN